MIFNDSRIYKMLKKIWQYVLPALAFLWEGLDDIWHFPYGKGILGSIAVVWGAMAIFLGISKHKYMNSATEVFIEDNGGIEDENGN